MFQVIHPPYKKVTLACIACLCFEIVLFGLLSSKGRTFPFFSPGSVSLGQSVLLGPLLSEGRTFPVSFDLALSLLGSQPYLGSSYLKEEPCLFYWFCHSWVVSPIWAVVI